MNQPSADVQRAGLDAVFDQDEERLKDALARGFRLNEFQHLSSPARQAAWHNPAVRSESPMSPFLRTIALNWYPGWLLLVNAFPDHIHRIGATGFPLLWETALHKTRRPMLQDMYQMGIDPLVRDERQRTSIHALFEGVRDDAIERPTPVDLVLCAKWLAGKGLDVYEPHPGDYHPNDIYKEGHTLWSYAVTQDAWHVALSLMPRRWEDVVRTPRWQPAMAYFRQRCALHRVHAGAAYQVLGQFLSRFLDEWVAETGDLLNDEPALPWVIRLAPDVRARLWSHWARPDAMGRMGWHRVAQFAGNQDLADLMTVARQDGVPLEQLWCQADKYGERPMDAWALALDAHNVPLPEDVWTVHRTLWKALPQDARELNDAIHDPSVETMLSARSQAWARTPNRRRTRVPTAHTAQMDGFRQGAGTAPAQEQAPVAG